MTKQCIQLITIKLKRIEMSKQRWETRIKTIKIHSGFVNTLPPKGSIAIWYSNRERIKLFKRGYSFNFKAIVNNLDIKVFLLVKDVLTLSASSAGDSSNSTVSACKSRRFLSRSTMCHCWMNHSEWVIQFLSFLVRTFGDYITHLLSRPCTDRDGRSFRSKLWMYRVYTISVEIWRVRSLWTPSG